jgi:hypothetical protein
MLFSLIDKVAIAHRGLQLLHSNLMGWDIVRELANAFRERRCGAPPKP